jgi:CRP-like cAMP-binding protein
VNHSGRRSSHLGKAIKMADQDRKEIERRLDQARRMAAATGDRATMERLTELIEELEGRLRVEKEEK